MRLADESWAVLDSSRTANELTPVRSVLNSGRTKTRLRRFHIRSTVTVFWIRQQANVSFRGTWLISSGWKKAAVGKRMGLDESNLSGWFTSQNETSIGLTKASGLGSLAFHGVFEAWNCGDRCQPELQSDATMSDWVKSIILHLKIGRWWPAVLLYVL